MAENADKEKGEICDANGARPTIAARHIQPSRRANRAVDGFQPSSTD
jgi:hypothetical protein